MKLGYALLLLCLSSRVGHAQSQSLPSLRGHSLAGAAVSLPIDLQGKVGIFVVGFSKQSGESGKAWGKAIKDAYARDANVAYYEVPVLAAVPALLRGVVLASMRHRIPGPDQAHVVPALQDAPQWKDAVHFSAADDAYVLVVNQAGVIQLRMHGFMTPIAQRALLDAVRSHEARTAVGRASSSSNG
jgi:hypothetical protein